MQDGETPGNQMAIAWSFFVTILAYKSIRSIVLI